KPHWLDDGSFLWHGEGKEGPQLEHRAKDGKLLKVISSPAQGFLGIVHVMPKDKEVVYRASTDPTQEHLFRAPVEEGKVVRLPREPGLHSATFNKSGSVYVHTASLLGEMPRSTVYKSDGTKVGDLPSVAEAPPFKVQQTIQEVGDKPSLWTTVVR